MLLSAGIPVEVCKVKAKEATAAQIAKARKRKDAANGDVSGNGWSRVNWEMSEAKIEDEEPDEGEQDEKLEKVGRWERSGKRVRVD